MNRFLTATLIMILSVSAASAQYRTPVNRGGTSSGLPGAGGGPQLSPYLNLLRGGNPAANYYLGVVPEQQRRAQAQQFGNALNQLTPQVENIEDYLGQEYTPTITAPGTASGFGYGAPPRLFGSYPPGFGTPLPMPPAPRVVPKPTDKQ